MPSLSDTNQTKKKAYDGSRWHGYEELGEVCCSVIAHWGSGGGNTPIVLETDGDDDREDDTGF